MRFPSLAMRFSARRREGRRTVVSLSFPLPAEKAFQARKGSQPDTGAKETFSRRLASSGMHVPTEWRDARTRPSHREPRGSDRATKLYDRMQEELSVDEVERIKI